MTRIAPKSSLRGANNLSSSSEVGGFSTISQRWSAVQTRLSNANSAFCYGVTTTRIYCRPTCLGRVAKRANVVFFDDIYTAKASGYRACQRCCPDDRAWTRHSRSSQTAELGQILIQERVLQSQTWTVADIAAQLKVSSAHLHRLFKTYSGTTPKEFAASLLYNEHPSMLSDQNLPGLEYQSSTEDYALKMSGQPTYTGVCRIDDFADLGRVPLENEFENIQPLGEWPVFDEYEPWYLEDDLAWLECGTQCQE